MKPSDLVGTPVPRARCFGKIAKRVTLFFPLWIFLYVTTCTVRVPSADLEQAGYFTFLIKEEKQRTCPGLPQLRMYLTAGVYTPVTDFTSITDADAVCMNDGNNPGSGNFKAFLVDGVNRNATVLPDAGDGQIDWVLKPNRTYMRASDGATITTTNDRGLLVFPFTNPLALSAWMIWTGMSGSFLTDVTCGGWSNQATTGRTGLTSSTTSGFLSLASSGCGVSANLVCVEQPSATESCNNQDSQ